jgi:hypothetical protein
LRCRPPRPRIAAIAEEAAENRIVEKRIARTSVRPRRIDVDDGGLGLLTICAKERRSSPLVSGG